MRKTIFTGLIIGILSLIALAPVAIGAPGDVIWTQAGNPSAYGDWANGVVVSGSSIYIVGSDQYLGSTNPRWRIEKRSLTNGSVIWTQASNPSGGWDEAYGVAVDGTGVYIVGYDSYLGNYRWRIEKRSLTTGSVIWIKTSNPSASGDIAFAVAVDGTGIYTVGMDEYFYLNSRWRIDKRSLTTGNVIWTTTSNGSASWDYAYGVAVDGTGVYIVGSDSYPGFSNSRWRMEKRSLATGSPIWTRISNPSTSDDWASGEYASFR